MKGWYEEVAPYGIDDGFSLGMRALKEGWHTVKIKRILAGTAPAGTSSAGISSVESSSVGTSSATTDYQSETRPDAHDAIAKELATVRLKLLEKQKRYTEYQHLALYYGLTQHFLHSLIFQKRREEVVEKAQELLTSTDDALAIAKELFDAHYKDEAITVASHGLTLEGRKASLGDWLGDTAESLGQRSLAQKAYITAFKEAKSFKRYKHVLKVTAPRGRESIKRDLLAFLKAEEWSNVNERVKIFLHEQLLDDAIETIENSGSSYYHESIKKVMTAVMNYKPKWVIEQAHKRALALIAEVKSKNYPYAIEWLRFEKRAYKTLNDIKGWQECITTLRTEHKPKRRLMALLTEAFGGA